MILTNNLDATYEFLSEQFKDQANYIKTFAGSDFP